MYVRMYVTHVAVHATCCYCRKEQYVQSLQTDLRAAPKQEFVERLEAELAETREQLQTKAEHLRKYDLILYIRMCECMYVYAYIYVHVHMCMCMYNYVCTYMVHTYM